MHLITPGHSVAPLTPFDPRFPARSCVCEQTRRDRGFWLRRGVPCSQGGGRRSGPLGKGPEHRQGAREWRSGGARWDRASPATELEHFDHASNQPEPVRSAAAPSLSLTPPSGGRGRGGPAADERKHDGGVGQDHEHGRASMIHPIPLFIRCFQLFDPEVVHN